MGQRIGFAEHIYIGGERMKVGEGICDDEMGMVSRGFQEAQERI